MDTVFIILFMAFLFFVLILYIPIALAVVTIVLFKSKTRRFLNTVIAVSVLVLIPTWDSLLGIVTYYVYRSHAKIVVFETAQTDGIYYDYEGLHDYVRVDEASTGSNRNASVPERTSVGSLWNLLERKYAYAESRVIEENSRPISPRYYRCTPLPKDPERPRSKRSQCIVIDRPMSPYMVKASDTRIGTATISTKKIYDRSTNRLMAEYRRVCREPFFPYFNWFFTLISIDDRKCGCRPVGGSEYDGFEFEVLKPKP